MVLRVDASAALGLEAGEAAAWLKESAPPPEESPQMRRLLRTLRQLDDKQLKTVGFVARSLLHPDAR
jgi:hypothetical protein